MGDDTHLLERAAECDQAALSQVYDRYAARIYRYVYWRLGDAQRAEDLTAEVFLRMLEAAQSERFARSSLSSWLYRIAHNLVVDHFRTHSRYGEAGWEGGLGPTVVDPAAAVTERLAQQGLRAALRLLTQDQQQVIVLRFGEGLSAGQVADVLGKSEGAVRALQHRALAALRRAMEGATE